MPEITPQVDHYALLNADMAAMQSPSPRRATFDAIAAYLFSVEYAAANGANQYPSLNDTNAAVARAREAAGR